MYSSTINTTAKQSYSTLQQLTKTLQIDKKSQLFFARGDKDLRFFFSGVTDIRTGEAWFTSRCFKTGETWSLSCFFRWIAGEHWSVLNLSQSEWDSFASSWNLDILGKPDKTRRGFGDIRPDCVAKRGIDRDRTWRRLWWIGSWAKFVANGSFGAVSSSTFTSKTKPSSRSASVSAERTLKLGDHIGEVGWWERELVFLALWMQRDFGRECGSRAGVFIWGYSWGCPGVMSEWRRINGELDGDFSFSFGERVATDFSSSI